MPSFQPLDSFSPVSILLAAGVKDIWNRKAFTLHFDKLFYFFKTHNDNLNTLFGSKKKDWDDVLAKATENITAKNKEINQYNEEVRASNDDPDRKTKQKKLKNVLTAWDDNHLRNSLMKLVYTILDSVFGLQLTKEDCHISGVYVCSTPLFTQYNLRFRSEQLPSLLQNVVQRRRKE